MRTGQRADVIEKRKCSKTFRKTGTLFFSLVFRYHSWDSSWCSIVQKFVFTVDLKKKKTLIRYIRADAQSVFDFSLGRYRSENLIRTDGGCGGVWARHRVPTQVTMQSCVQNWEKLARFFTSYTYIITYIIML